ncbi:MAG: response regulator transcription factor, partial [Bacteroidetes bacterium]|nr:response regulator transcription factor [Bacteroidota bacterium]
VVGEACNGIDAVEKALALNPDVVIMDLALPKKSGCEAIGEIQSSKPEIKILIFSSSSDNDQIMAAIQAGAIGYLLKDSAPQEICAAIRKVHEGKPVLNPQVEISILHQIQHNRTADYPVEILTEREIKILRWLAQGLTDYDIAKIAHVTPGTVRSHISSVLNKLGLNNRAQAVIYALKKGLIKI